MSKLSFVALLALMSVPLPATAQVLYEVESLTLSEPPAGAPRTVGEAMERLRAERGRELRSALLSDVHASVILNDDQASAYLIPIAGNTAGGGGTYFRSDVTFINARSSLQRVGVGWLAAGADNRNAPLTYLNLAANSVVTQFDFVGVVLQRTGLGAITVFGVDAAGNNDSGAKIDGTSRIWTLQPGSAGSVSQQFDAVSVSDLIGSFTATVTGLRQDADFRTNFGIVNLDSVAHTWTARSLFTGVTTPLTIPPYSVIQTTLAAGSATASGKVAFTLESSGVGGFWSAYGTSLDNRTGDGWVTRAKQ